MTEHIRAYKVVRDMVIEVKSEAKSNEASSARGTSVSSHSKGEKRDI